MTSSTKNPYEHLDKSALIALVMERDNTIQAQRQDLLNAADHIKKLRRLLDLRNKKIFGSSSEKSNHSNTPEDIEFEEIVDKNKDKKVQEDEARQPTEVVEDGTSAPVAKKKRSYKNGHPGRSPLPPELDRVEKHHYPEGYQPDWNRELPVEITERLVFESRCYVQVDIFHKFARDGRIVIAPRPLDDTFYKYKATPELVCHMMHLRFGLHLPYYRFLQLLSGCGITYNTLIGWSARGFEILMPLKAILAEEILKDTKLLCMDETPFKLLDSPDKVMEFKAELKTQEAAMDELAAKEKAKKQEEEKEKKGGNNQQEQEQKKQKKGKQQQEKKKKKKKTLSSATEDEEEDENAALEAEIAAGLAKGKVVLRGQMWTLLNPTTKLVSYEYSSSRGAINARRMLVGYKGTLMADAYAAYRKLARLSPEAIILLACWAHARRRILESQDPKHQDKVVKEIIRRIGALYEIERKIKGRSPKAQKRMRKRSAKLLRSLKAYMESKIEEYAPKEAVHIAIQYCLNHWDALSAYVQHTGSIIDNNCACTKPSAVLSAFCQFIRLSVV